MVNMQYISAQLNIFYDPVDNVKQYADSINENLKPYFASDLQVIPFPTPVPVGVPVIMGSNMEQNHMINISGTSIHLEKKFALGTEIDSAMLYSFCQKVYDLTEVFDRKNQILYCGVTLLGVIHKKDANRFLFEKFHKLVSENDVYDVNTKFTFVEDDKYYINITLGNIRDNKGESDAISIELDINDRYRFNFNKALDPYSKSDILEVLKGKLSLIVNEKINILIEEGRF